MKKYDLKFRWKGCLEMLPSRFILGVSASLWLIFSLAGCAGRGDIRPESVQIIRPGDKADISFLCRLQAGEIVAATDMKAVNKSALPKSAVFIPRSEDNPVSVTAADSLPAPQGKEWAFEDEIIIRLSEVVVGMKEGESRTVTLTAEELPERTKEDYVVRMARKREQPKEMRMTIDEYRSRTGKSPKVGQPVVTGSQVSGRVEAVTEGEVVLRFSAQAGNVLQTPFGPERILETERAYEIVVDAREGELVRAAHLVGRISEVTENYFTLDYRHPFGGEKFICDVAVEKIEKINRTKSETGESNDR